MRRAATLLIGLTLTCLAAATAYAGELAGVSMAESSTAGEQTLVLNGMALRSKAIFKVYVAGLYLPEKASDAAAVLAADTPRQLIMHWVRSVGQEKICDGWYEGLEANTPAAEAAKLKPDFDRLCGHMEDAKTGDRFVFTYLPGRGTAIEIKGQEKGWISGKAFADGLFASWIGPHPGPGEDFREALMGH